MKTRGILSQRRRSYAVTARNMGGVKGFRPHNNFLNLQIQLKISLYFISLTL